MTNVPEHFDHQIAGGLPSNREVVINFHMNEGCNYRCHYCYATWGIDRTQEIHNDLGRTIELLQRLYTGFTAPDSGSSTRPERADRSVRLNLVGGEPCLVRNFRPILDVALRIGFDVGIVTNGSFIDADFVDRYARHLSVVGVSVDAVEPDRMRRIGRATASGRTLKIPTLISNLQRIRSLNRNCTIKINTVVNRHNFDHDLRSFIRAVAPDKWKVLRVLPNVHPSAAITDGQYARFLETHRDLAAIMYPEENEAMRGSYIMIDPLGRFFDNTVSGDSETYRYSAPILDVGVEKAFGMIRFDAARFTRRYDRDAIDASLAQLPIMAAQLDAHRHQASPPAAAAFASSA